MHLLHTLTGSIRDDLPLSIVRERGGREREEERGEGSERNKGGEREEEREREREPSMNSQQ